jgi:hypothetical protein
MEHSVPLDTRPWRTATLVASAVAALELFVIVAAGVALLGDRLSDPVRQAAEERVLGPAVKPAPKPKPGATKPSLTRAETSVYVMNGNGQRGAAAETAARVRSIGYTVGSVGNATRSDYGRSVVMYRRGFRPEALRLAKDLKVKLVSPLDGLRPRELMGAHVALVVGHSA